MNSLHKEGLTRFFYQDFREVIENNPYYSQIQKTPWQNSPLIISPRPMENNAF